MVMRRACAFRCNRCMAGLFLLLLFMCLQLKPRLSISGWGGNANNPHAAIRPGEDATNGQDKEEDLGASFLKSTSRDASFRHGSRHHLHARENYVVPVPGSDWNGTYNPFYFFVYSAFYDDREMHPAPRINIWGVMKLGILRKSNVSCLYRLEGGESAETTARGMTMDTNDFTSDGIEVGAFLIWCAPPSIDSVPTKVTVVYTDKTRHELGSVEIERMPKAERKGFLAACVCALYAPDKPEFPHLRPSAIVQWLEMERIMGVEHVTVYVNGVSVSVLATLRYYASRGYVTLRTMSPIDGDPYKQPRFTSVADCMQRHMHSHHHVHVGDFDEMIVPRDNLTIAEFIARYSSDHNLKHAHFQFQNVNFFTDGTDQNPRIPEYLSFLRTTNHQTPHPFPGPMKSIQDPSVCLYASNHRCILDRDKAKTIFIPHTTAANQHYKACVATRSHPWNCTQELRSLRRDDVMLRYEHPLANAVQRTLRHLARYMELDVNLQSI